MRAARRLIELAVWLGLTALAVGCSGRLHLTRTHGQSYRESFRAQVVSPAAGTSSQPQSGLDSQEAAIIAENYRKSLAPAGQGAAKAPAPIIMIAPER